MGFSSFELFAIAFIAIVIYATIETFFKQRKHNK